jgi:predicted O-methyltransferase YrrM
MGLGRLLRVPATFDEAWAAASQAEGWLTEPQGRLLFSEAGRVGDGEAVVEVGSHHGKSTILLALGLREGATMTAIDPFDDPRWGGGPEALQSFRRNLDRAGVADRVALYRGLSADAARSWTGPQVGLAWLDGAHDLKSVLDDIDGWCPRIATGGRLLVHDAFSAIGTTRAVLRRLWWSRSFRYVGCERTLLVFSKEERSAVGALTDAMRMSRRLVFFARVVAIKLARRKNLRRVESFLMRVPNEPLI